MQANSRYSVRFTVLAFLAALVGACGGQDENRSSDSGTDAPAAAATADGLSAEELELGIGPIRHLDLAAVDPTLAARGAEVFSVKCSACHKLEERYVGPPLGDVAERRTPEFIMNMILNPEEMVARHPEVKAMLAQYYTPMPDQQLTEEDARAVLEYLRVPSDVETPAGGEE